MSLMDERTDFDLCVVGGAGHVGLPLALIFADHGLRVILCDRNQAALDAISNGDMPFMESGGQEVLDRVLKTNRLHFSTETAVISRASVIVVTIGTPVDEFFNPNLKDIYGWLDEASPHLSNDKLLVLRSTLFPGTTQLLANVLSDRDLTPEIAFCPERIVQGKAIEELLTLPQLISGITPAATQSAKDFFNKISVETVELTVMEAELAKLFANAYRYIQFAAANQFYMIAAKAGLDYNKILAKLKHNYPRAQDIPKSGFAAGPCLLKDTMQIAAFSQNNFPLGHAAMSVNEGLVLHMADQLKAQFDLANETVGLLGMAFKANNDDIRSSLSYKLKKVIKFHAREVLTTDPHVSTDASLLPVEEVIERSDRLVLCVPHNKYRGLNLKGKYVLDIWNFFEN